MNRSDLRVAIRELGDDKVVIHAAGDPGANYDTLCGVSTSDDLFEVVDDAPSGRINCAMCWQCYALARTFLASDFTDAARRGFAP